MWANMSTVYNASEHGLYDATRGMPLYDSARCVEMNLYWDARWHDARSYVEQDACLLARDALYSLHYC